MNHRHAYLIMAHDNLGQLRKLLSLLDDERNDIYLHIDAAADFSPDCLKNAVQSSKLTAVDRIPVFWAEYSQVKAELNLLREAVNTGNSGGVLLLSSAVRNGYATKDTGCHSCFL